LRSPIASTDNLFPSKRNGLEIIDEDKHEQKISQFDSSVVKTLAHFHKMEPSITRITEDYDEKENIFDTDPYDQHHHKEFDFGLKKDTDGKLQRRSILGDVGAFEKRLTMMNKRNSRISGFAMAGIASKMISRTLSQRSSSIIHSDRSRTHYKDMEISSSRKCSSRRGSRLVEKLNVVEKVERPERINLTNLSKADLLREVDNHQQRREMSLMDYRTIDKEEKVLDRHNRIQRIWKRDAESLAKETKRPINELAVIKADDYRQKVENIEELEMKKTDGMIFGEKLWMMSLRRHKKNKSQNLEKLEIETDSLKYRDLPDAFSKELVRAKRNFVEKIRKNDFLEDKADTLIIHGKSQLEIEKEMIVKSKNRAFVRNQDLFNQEHRMEADEVLVSSFQPMAGSTQTSFLKTLR